VVGPLGDDLNLWRREIRVCVYGHALERHDSADRDESNQHQHQESLA